MSSHSLASPGRPSSFPPQLCGLLAAPVLCTNPPSPLSYSYIVITALVAFPQRRVDCKPSGPAVLPNPSAHTQRLCKCMLLPMEQRPILKFLFSNHLVCHRGLALFPCDVTGASSKLKPITLTPRRTEDTAILIEEWIPPGTFVLAL